MTNTNRNQSKTCWHCLLAKVFEGSLTRLNVSVQTEVDVVSGSPKADIILLRREGKAWTEEQKAWLCDGLRDTSARELLIEFKFTESVNEAAIAQLFINDNLYRAKQKLTPNELKSFLLASKTPRLDLLESHGFKLVGQKGVYETEYPQFSRLRLIVLNELADLPHNALVKCFASREQEWHKGFSRMIGRGLTKISMDFEYIISGIRSMRMKRMTGNVEPIGWTPEAVMDLGRRTWFEAMMNAMPEEELFKFRRTVNIREEGREEGREEEGRKIILGLLTNRFGSLPSAIQEKIAKANTESLECWGGRLLDAVSLEDVFATDPPVSTH